MFKHADNKAVLPLFYNNFISRIVYSDIADVNSIEKSITNYKLMQIKSVIEPKKISISTSWPGSNFDGCVMYDEAIVDKKSHFHIPFSDHRILFFSSRLLALIYYIFKK